MISTPRNAEILRYQELLQEVIKNAKPYPGGLYEGKGIVICAGGIRYFTCAWVCIHMLRHLGCTLPIQIWHLGPDEMSAEMRDLLLPLGASVVDACDVRKDNPARILNGWELKPYSIIHCPFEEVLFLDADNVCVKDPSFFFDSPEFRREGAIFWPDYGRLGPHRAIWSICEIEHHNEPEFESGQIVVHKEKCWTALQLTMHMNEHSDFYYRYIHGDKETFHMAFRRVGKSYAMPTRGIHSLSGTMCQHDFSGERVFQHRNMAKWSILRENRRISGFLFEDLCKEFLADLKSRWSGTLGTMRRFQPQQSSSKEMAMMLKLISAEWLYERVGYDSRKMTFLPNGCISEGAAGCEIFWDVEVSDSDIVLFISSETNITCHLALGPAFVWRGRWRRHERMPILLSPWPQKNANGEDRRQEMVT